MKHFSSKDMINIGIFTTLFLLVNITISGFVVVPILQYVMMPVMALCSAPVYLLYITKVKKFGAIIITGLISSTLIGLIVYGNVLCFLVNMMFFIIAELIAYKGKYISSKLNNLSYIILSFFAIGEAGLPWTAPVYFHTLSVNSGYSLEWADGVIALATPTSLIIMVVATILCGIISIIFSNNMFKKHFIKAGII